MANEPRRFLAVTSLYLVGGGGHCLSVIDVIETTKRYKIEGIFDDNLPKGEKILGYPILGGDSGWDAVLKNGEFLITVGQIRSATIRKKLFEQLKNKNAKMATVIAPSAIVSPHAQLGEGTVVMHQALVNAGARVGVNAIINNKSLIEHGVSVGQHCHISTGALVNGDVKIGDECFIGSGAVLRQGLEIPSGSFIQAGEFVNR